jgi:hypothetical protein
LSQTKTENSAIATGSGKIARSSFAHLSKSFQLSRMQYLPSVSLRGFASVTNMNKGEQEKVFLLCTAKAKTTIILILVILVEDNMDCNLRASEVPMVFQQTFHTTGTLSLYELDYSALFHTTKTCNPLSCITNQRKLT